MMARGMARDRLLVAGLGVAVLAVGVFVLGRLDSKETITVSAQFADSTGVYEGNQVTMMGVKVGEVTDVVPEGTTIRVVMEIDTDVPIPADAAAVVLQDSLIADRYIGLAPAYESGPKLEDGAEIPLTRTKSPIGYDDLVRSVDGLLVAVGNGPTSRGIGELVEIGAANLEGAGDDLRSALTGVDQTVAMLAGNDEQLVEVVRNSDRLLRAFATRNDVVAAFSDEVTAVTEQFAADRGPFARAVRRMGRTLLVVSDFVRENRSVLIRDVADLAAVVRSAMDHREQLIETTDVFPLVMQNIIRLYDPTDRRMRVYPELTQALRDSHAAQMVCPEIPEVCDLIRDQLVGTVGTADDLLVQLLGGLP